MEENALRCKTFQFFWLYHVKIYRIIVSQLLFLLNGTAFIWISWQSECIKLIAYRIASYRTSLQWRQWDFWGRVAQWTKVQYRNHKVAGSSPTVSNVLCSWVRHFTIITPWFESHVKLVVPCGRRITLHARTLNATGSFGKSRGSSRVCNSTHNYSWSTLFIYF